MRVVAVVSSAAISFATYRHWLYVEVKQHAPHSPGFPVIVPDDPPGFHACVAENRTKLPVVASESTAMLQRTCAAQFKFFNVETMSFLIQAHWIEDEAAREGVRVSNARVNRVLAIALHRRFPDTLALDDFLKRTGQTRQDLLYQVRIRILNLELLANQRVKGRRAAADLQRDFVKYWLPRTYCERLRAMFDCAGVLPGGG